MRPDGNVVSTCAERPARHEETSRSRPSSNQTATPLSVPNVALWYHPGAREGSFTRSSNELPEPHRLSELGVMLPVWRAPAGFWTANTTTLRADRCYADFSALSRLTLRWSSRSNFSIHGPSDSMRPRRWVFKTCVVWPSFSLSRRCSHSMGYCLLQDGSVSVKKETHVLQPVACCERSCPRAGIRAMSSDTVIPTVFQSATTFLSQPNVSLPC